MILIVTDPVVISVFIILFLLFFYFNYYLGN